jgi:hypothetical protein
MQGICSSENLHNVEIVFISEINSAGTLYSYTSQSVFSTLETTT